MTHPAILLLTGSSMATAGPPPPPIVGGTDGSSWPAAGALVARGGDGDAIPYCSGTLVGPATVLTAAHCAASLAVYASHDYPTWFLMGADIDAGADEALAVITATAHPDYDAEAGDRAPHDLAVLTLEADAVTSPLPVATGPVGDGWIGEPLTVVGFGSAGDDGAGGGVRRAAEVPIVDFDVDWLYTLDEEDGQNLCHGDSGGPALREGGDGEAVVAVGAWVFAWADPDNACEGGGAALTRLDQHRSWLRSVLPEDIALDTGAAPGAGAEGDSAPDTAEGTAAKARPCGCGRGSGAGIGGLALALAAALRRRH